MELKNGINLGGWFSQCVKNEDHYRTFISKDDFISISRMNYDHVRIPVDYDFLMNEKAEKIENHFRMLEKAFEWCAETGLKAVLEIQDSFTEDSAEDVLLQERFIELWKILAEKYGYLDFVAFELSPETNESENLAGLLEKTREAINDAIPQSTVIYSGDLWNDGGSLQFLQLPKAPNIISKSLCSETLIFAHDMINADRNLCCR